MARRSTIDPRRPATRHRPAWRTPIEGPAHTIKQPGDVEMTATGFARLTLGGYERID